jgi:hypothetical protein
MRGDCQISYEKDAARFIQAAPQVMDEEYLTRFNAVYIYSHWGAALEMQSDLLTSPSVEIPTMRPFAATPDPEARSSSGS